MSEKNFTNVRIVHKHDVESNWLKAVNFIPKQGEIIVYDKDNTYNYERIKIGDGSTLVSDLPFETNKSLKVTVSRDANGNNIVDKTYKEIYDAVHAGAHVYMVTGNTIYVDFNSVWPNTILWLSYCSDYSVMFSHQDGSSEYEVEIDSDGNVSVYYSSSLPSQYSYGYEGMVLTVGENGEVNPADFPDTLARTTAVDEVRALVGDTSVSEQINDALANNQGDWSVNDETNPSYIKNRTHYDNTTFVEVLSECQPTAVEGGFTLKNEVEIIDGNKYTVNWNGASYVCVATSTNGLVILGNGQMLDMEDTGEPFIMAFYPSYMAVQAGIYAQIVALDGSSTCTISITKHVEDIHKIDNKYLPDEVLAQPDWNAAEGELGHILNRTHYTEEVLDEIISEITVTFGDATRPGRDTGSVTGSATQIYPERGEMFVIEWNGVKYYSTVRSYTKDDGSFGRGIGNTGMFGGSVYPEYPFLIGFLTEAEAAKAGYTYFVCVNDGSTAATFSAYKVGEAVHRLDAKYLPENVVTTEYVDEQFSRSAHITPINADNTMTIDEFMALEDGYYSVLNHIKVSDGGTYSVDIYGLTFKMSPYYIECYSIGQYLDVYPNNDDKYVLHGKYTLDGFGEELAARKLNAPMILGTPNVDNGTSGQVLSTNGDGTTSWVDVVDSTLAQSGKAADAKIVGERIGNLEELVGNEAVSEQIATAANEKMNKENPVGTGSLSMNRKSGSNEGISSTTLGYNGSASGQYALAEGAVTSASGYASHAEGYNTNATRHAQHVEGQFNILDTEGTIKGKYIHIVGNGTALDKRSNAHTLDWNGLGWFAGGVKIGGTNQDDENAKELATQEYVIEQILAMLAARQPKIATVELKASAWVGEGSLYSQVVEIEGVTEHSQVDLTPSIEQLVIFYEKDLGFVTENEDGVVTVYAIGQKPANDYTIQVTITEVNV